jgi:adenylate cyclase class 2
VAGSSSSGKETEIKLRAASPAEAASRLEAAGFHVLRPRAFEANLLLDTVDARFQSSGEALRVRERGGETILTYKGPAETNRHKSREEIETSAGDASALLAVLARLGFHPTYRYEKFRTEYARASEDGIATVDETPLGCFMELEGDPEWIDRTAQLLGFAEKDYINDSYSALFRRYCQLNGMEIGAGMIFGESLSENLGQPKPAGTKVT